MQWVSGDEGRGYMIKHILSCIAGIVLCLSLILVMSDAKEWYLYPVLFGAYLLIWRYGLPVSAWKFYQLMAGEVASIAALQVSLIYGIALLCSVVAIFLLQMNVLVSRSEVFWFLVFTFIVAGSALLLDLSPDILIPIVIILFAGGIAGVYVLLDEDRVMRMYRGGIR